MINTPDIAFLLKAADLREVRVALHSVCTVLPTATGRTPEGLLEEEGVNPDEPTETHYFADGLSAVFEDGSVSIGYVEPPQSGMEHGVTRIRFARDAMERVDFKRSGDSCLFLPLDTANPSQTVLYQTPFGSLDAHLQLLSLENHLKTHEGTLKFSYLLDFNGFLTEKMEVVIRVRPMRESERRADLHLPEGCDVFFRILIANLAKDRFGIDDEVMQGGEAYDAR